MLSTSLQQVNVQFQSNEEKIQVKKKQNKKISRQERHQVTAIPPLFTEKIYLDYDFHK